MLEYETQVSTTSFITHETATHDEHATIFVRSDRCRIDGWYGSYILRSDLGKFWVLFARNRTYWEFGLPVRLEDEIAEGSRDTLAEASRNLAALVEVTPTTESGRIGDRRVELWRASVRQPFGGLTRDLKIWLATDLDLPLVRETTRNILALNVLIRDWYREILDLEGVEVRYEEKSRSRTKLEEITRKLVSLRKEVLNEELFEIPEGFERSEFQLDAVFSIQTPQEMPSRDP